MAFAALIDRPRLGIGMRCALTSRHEHPTFYAIHPSTPCHGWVAWRRRLRVELKSHVAVRWWLPDHHGRHDDIVPGLRRHSVDLGHDRSGVYMDRDQQCGLPDRDSGRFWRGKRHSEFCSGRECRGGSYGDAHDHGDRDPDHAGRAVTTASFSAAPTSVIVDGFASSNEPSPSSSGQDVALSRPRPGFDSRWGRQLKISSHLAIGESSNVDRQSAIGNLHGGDRSRRVRVRKLNDITITNGECGVLDD